jgi:DNA (cytosine-5)-methyltransferase 3A
MKVLSLFDGISCGRLALERAGIKVEKYYASEIDKYAIQVAQKNYPDTIQIGDCTKIDYKKYAGEIDLLIGGSPCQGFSFAGKQLNFADPRSRLFFEFVRALKEVKPKYFLLENVKMKKEFQDIISQQLGVDPIEINSALVSAQNRKRLYWTNIPNLVLPTDKNIVLKNIVPDAVLTKSKTIRTSGWCSKWGNKHCFDMPNPYRHFTITELELLQTLPINYTDGISLTQRRKAIGNGWTVDAIAHIFKGLKSDN